MKSLISALSDKGIIALCAVICLTPFAHLHFVETLSPAAMFGIGAILFVFACLYILPFPNTKSKYLVTVLLKQRWIVIAMLAWLLLIAISVVVMDSGKLVFSMTLAAFVMGWLVFVESRSENNMMNIVRALGISALIVIVFALFETFDVQPISTWLNTFNGDAPFVDIVRISSILDHPNHMAAYLELTLPFVLVWMSAASHQALKQILAFALAIGLIVFVLSLSRGGMLSFGIALVTFGIFAFYARQKLLALTSLTMVGIIILAVVAQVLVTPRIWVRYLSEGSNDLWYRAVFHVQEAVQAEPGQALHLSVDVTNTGLFEWETEGSQPVNLGYHIICWDEDTPASLAGVDMSSLYYLTTQGPRTALPYNVAQGETVTLNVSLTAPTAPGHYLIAWDMVQESVTWFNEKGLVPAATALDVAGVATSSTCGTQVYKQAEKPDHPSRLKVWRTALQVIRDNPWMGIGVGNFDAYYDRYNGDEFHVPHPHNSYLTLLVDFGVFASLFIAFALFSIARMLVKARPSADDKRGWHIWFAICVALTSIGLHGVVESFNYRANIFLVVCVIVGVAARLAVEKGNRAGEAV